MAEDTAGPELITIIPSGGRVDLQAHRVPEMPTVFVFCRPGVGGDRGFAEGLAAALGDRAGIRLVALETGAEPAAAEHGIAVMPTAVVLDRRGDVVVRSTDAEEVLRGVVRAAERMRIDWAQPGDGRFEEAQQILGRPMLPGILRTMSLKPEYMRYLNDLSVVAHFNDGFLKRRHKEMIATYVSALNRCRY
jgi:hypothetical protein